jgi:hypothetical protein
MIQQYYQVFATPITRVDKNSALEKPLELLGTPLNA